jgi:hypothetical protein
MCVMQVGDAGSSQIRCPDVGRNWISGQHGREVDEQQAQEGSPSVGNQEEAEELGD